MGTVPEPDKRDSPHFRKQPRKRGQSLFDIRRFAVSDSACNALLKTGAKLHALRWAPYVLLLLQQESVDRLGGFAAVGYGVDYQGGAGGGVAYGEDSGL